jgi:two-component sensor histidine kinase
VKDSKKAGAFWPWSPGSRRSFERLAVPLGPFPHALLLLILIPCISLAALLLCEMNIRASAAARTRVALPASSIDHGTLSITALLTNAPHGNAEDKSAGINLWLASAANGTDPVLLQARMPLATLNVEATGNWISSLLVTSLLTAAALVGATFLSRKLLKKYGSPSQSRMSPDNGMLMHFAAAAHPEFNERRQQPTKAENHLRMALRAGGMGAWQWDRRSGTLRLDSTLADLLKKGSSEGGDWSAKALLAQVEHHDRRRLVQAVRSALSNSQPLGIDIRHTRFDGEQRWFAIRGAPMRDQDGQIIGLVGIAYDITDQKQSLSRTDALLREVSHRSKNMLALILAMARLTAREAVDVKSHLKDFALRVAGLAASQDLIVATDWQSVDFGALAFAEVEAVARSDAARVTITGPSFLVTPEAAQTLGMIVTELTLNAVEHGALSAAGGEVRLSWEFPDDATIMISWHETGGPDYDPELPKGYGMQVVERFSTQGLKVNSHVASDAGGFTWILTGPIANLGKRPPPHRT